MNNETVFDFIASFGTYNLSGSNTDFCGTTIAIPSPQVSDIHAWISYKDNSFFLTYLRSEHGTWIADIEGKRYRIPHNFPTRIRSSDVIELGSNRKVQFRVKVLKVPQKLEDKSDLQPVS